MSTLVISKNDFSSDKFDEVCNALESGNHVKVVVDCFGLTHNHMVQNIYKDVLEKTYGDRLFTKSTGSNDCFCYEYDLLY